MTAHNGGVDFARSRAILFGTSVFTEGFDQAPMPAAANSLKAVNAALTRACGWPKSQITMFADLSTRDAPSSLIAPLIHQADDVLLFYYVGHGQLLVDNDLGLALTDTSEDARLRLSTSLRLGWLHQELKYNCEARVKILVLDCCASGVATKYAQGSHGTATAIHQAAEPGGEGMYTWTACGHSQETYFEPGPSGLTYFARHLTDVLANGIEGKGPSLTITDVHNEVGRRLRHAQIPDVPVNPEPTLLFRGSLDLFQLASNVAFRDAEVSDTSSHAKGDLGPGVPIAVCDPLALDVHPAGDGLGRGVAARLPGYVQRPHDEILAGVVARTARGASEMAVLVGSSSTGKTRACWEAVQPLADLGWTLWQPLSPTPVRAAFGGIESVRPRTVVWLNEAQRFLSAGEEMAAALHDLLTDPRRAPVLVLGTLWPEYDQTFSRRPEVGLPDPHVRTRELLAGRRVVVPDAFDDTAIEAARHLAESGDKLLAAVLAHENDRRFAQYLAGAPELLHRYQTASSSARALLCAAIDARRLGSGLLLPGTFLVEAAAGYLHAENELPDDHLEHALVELAVPVHGNIAPLRLERTPGRVSKVIDSSAHTPSGPQYRLADVLEQHGRRNRWAFCPPNSFWQSAHAHFDDPDDLQRLADAARDRYRLQWADALYQQSADAGSDSALNQLALMRSRSGDGEGAEALAIRAARGGDALALTILSGNHDRVGERRRAEALADKAAEAGDGEALYRLAASRRTARWFEKAEDLLQRAADVGNPDALSDLALIRHQSKKNEEAEELAGKAAKAGNAEALTVLIVTLEREGDRERAEGLARRAAAAGNASMMTRLASIRTASGDSESARALLDCAAEAGDAEALTRLAQLREQSDDVDGAEALYRRAVEEGSAEASTRLTEMREDSGDADGAEAVALQAARTGSTEALTRLAVKRDVNGDRDGAEAIAMRAADAGNSDVLASLVMARDQAGDREGARALAARGAETGYGSALTLLAAARAKTGDRKGAEALYRQAADIGYPEALDKLAAMREKVGDREGAEALYWRAVDAGDVSALIRLFEMREEVGDIEGAARLAIRAADAGNDYALVSLATKRERAKGGAEKQSPQYGINPDGTPTDPWW
ncbi:MAG TPA: caspase family protein [Actinospica sp.]|jgi:TPR repeat protein|nr:caspase family protein [Actinospica sp.]